MPIWTFITNHGAVLALITSSSQLTTRQLASELGITERSVLRIIRDLEEEGYLERSKDGRQNRYVVDREHPLGRPDVDGRTVGELLRLLRPKLPRPAARRRLVSSGRR